jgi:hypothetical protein
MPSNYAIKVTFVKYIFQVSHPVRRCLILVVKRQKFPQLTHQYSFNSGVSPL